MSHQTRIVTTALVAALSCAGLLSCEGAKTPAAQRGDSMPAGLVVSQVSPAAIGVLEVRKSAKPGDHVTVLGRIGGSRMPFVSTQAVFTIVDSTLESCVEMGDDDHCPRPWDYCCEDKASLARAMASIEIAGANGKPLAIALADEGSLKPLMLVAVEGTVQSTDGGSLVVRADRICRIPGDPLEKHIH